jgi:hypothetical protein
MRSLATGLTAITLLAVAPSRAQAQHPFELGLDAALAISLDEPRVTTLAIPFQRFRVGIFTSPTRSYEPWLAVNFIAVEGAGDFSTINLGLGVLFHLSPDRTRTQAYLRPFGGITTVSVDGSETDAHLGLGVGFKTPWTNRRLATRIEPFLQHAFSEPDGVTSIGLLFGLSYFTR